MPDSTNKPTAPRRRQGWALAAVAGILAVAAIGLNGSAAWLKLNFRKEAVEPRRLIQSIPTELGPWLMFRDTRLSPDVEASLQTDRYVERLYVDTRKADADVVDAYHEAEAKTPELIEGVAQSALRNDPMAMVRLHVPYYTGAVDTVPHIPDRCMLGAGFEMGERKTVYLDLPGHDDNPDGTLAASFAAFQGTGSGQSQLTRALYFFQVNGDYEHDAITGVRKRLQNLFESHRYFAKIEVTHDAPIGEAFDDESIAIMTDFLRVALPEIEAVLPDWDAVMASANEPR